MNKPLEYCLECNDLTGLIPSPYPRDPINAGRLEDSLFCDICENGPYCADCFVSHTHERKEPYPGARDEGEEIASIN